jgi:hypothetical protein
MAGSENEVSPVWVYQTPAAFISRRNENADKTPRLNPKWDSCCAAVLQEQLTRMAAPTLDLTSSCRRYPSKWTLDLNDLQGSL